MTKCVCEVCEKWSKVSLLKFVLSYLFANKKSQVVINYFAATPVCGIILSFAILNNFSARVA